MVHPPQHSPRPCCCYFCVHLCICPHPECFTVPVYGCAAGLLCFYCFNSVFQFVCGLSCLWTSSVTYQSWPPLKSVSTPSSCTSTPLLLIPWISQVWCVEFIPKMGLHSLFELRMFAPIWTHMHEKHEQTLHLHECTRMNLKLIFVLFKIIKYDFHSAHSGACWLVKRPLCSVCVGK